MRYLPRERLIKYGVNLLVAKGVPEANARIIAETAVDTEAMGVSTHGAAIFPYFEAQINGELDPKAEPQVVREKGATALIDGRSGFAQLALAKAKELGAAKARKFGVGMVAGRNCFWLGGMGVYLVSLAQEGFFAQLWSQTSTCKDCAPFGGIEAKFSTNPLALGVPLAGEPVIGDFSTASVSMGKVKRMAERGERSKEPLFLDREGETSDDPRVVLEGGSILFLGGAYLGYKGYALSFWGEAMAALAGGDANNPKAPTRQCFSLTVIDPEAFAGREYYEREMERFVAHLKSNRLRTGFKQIRLPGERAMRSLKEAASRGIPLEEGMIARLNEVARKNGIEEL